jgi:protein arginine N-methyltransferase 3
VRPWAGDEHLQPVLPDDEMLLHDWEPAADGGGFAADPAEQLEAENEGLRAALAALQELVLQDGASSAMPAAPRGPAAEAAASSLVDATYFDSYSFFDIHREMLSDRVRTEAYRRALELNPALVRGATVLDVGCGTGVLSMFAARGGAARVVAVDGSARIAAVARRICADNGVGAEGGGPVTVVSSRVEAMEALPGGGGKADVLVSEWMGEAAILWPALFGGPLP